MNFCLLLYRMRKLRLILLLTVLITTALAQQKSGGAGGASGSGVVVSICYCLCLVVLDSFYFLFSAIVFSRWTRRSRTEGIICKLLQQIKINNKIYKQTYSNLYTINIHITNKETNNI